MDIVYSLDFAPQRSLDTAYPKPEKQGQNPPRFGSAGGSFRPWASPSLEAPQGWWPHPVCHAFAIAHHHPIFDGGREHIDDLANGVSKGWPFGTGYVQNAERLCKHIRRACFCPLPAAHCTHTALSLRGYGCLGLFLSGFRVVLGGFTALSLHPHG